MISSSFQLQHEQQQQQNRISSEGGQRKISSNQQAIFVEDFNNEIPQTINSSRSSLQSKKEKNLKITSSPYQDRLSIPIPQKRTIKVCPPKKPPIFAISSANFSNELKLPFPPNEHARPRQFVQRVILGNAAPAPPLLAPRFSLHEVTEIQPSSTLQATETETQSELSQQQQHEKSPTNSYRSIPNSPLITFDGNNSQIEDTTCVALQSCDLASLPSIQTIKKQTSSNLQERRKQQTSSVYSSNKPPSRKNIQNNATNPVFSQPIRKNSSDLVFIRMAAAPTNQRLNNQGVPAFRIRQKELIQNLNPYGGGYSVGISSSSTLSQQQQQQTNEKQLIRPSKRMIQSAQSTYSNQQNKPQQNIFNRKTVASLIASEKVIPKYRTPQQQDLTAYPPSKKQTFQQTTSQNYFQQQQQQFPEISTKAQQQSSQEIIRSSLEKNSNPKQPISSHATTTLFKQNQIVNHHQLAQPIISVSEIDSSDNIEDKNHPSSVEDIVDNLNGGCSPALSNSNSLLPEEVIVSAASPDTQILQANHVEQATFSSHILDQNSEIFDPFQREFYGTIREEENEDFDQTPGYANNIFKRLGQQQREALEKELKEESESISNLSLDNQAYFVRGNHHITDNNSIHKQSKIYQRHRCSSQLVPSLVSANQNSRKRGISFNPRPNLSTPTNNQLDCSFSAQNGVFETSSLNSSMSSDFQFSTNRLPEPNECQKLSSEDLIESTLTSDNLQKLITEEMENRMKELSLQQKIDEIERVQKLIDLEKQHQESKPVIQDIPKNSIPCQPLASENGSFKPQNQLQQVFTQQQQSELESEQRALDRLKGEFEKLTIKSEEQKNKEPCDRDEEELFQQYSMYLSKKLTSLSNEINQKQEFVNLLKGNDLSIYPSSSEPQQLIEKSTQNAVESHQDNISSCAETKITQLTTEIRSDILKEGWLFKHSPSMFKGWKARYFLLTASKIQYFKDETKSKLRGCVNFKLAACNVTDINGEKFNLEVSGYKRRFVLKSSSKFCTAEWINLINLAIADNSQVEKPSISQNKVLQYFKKDLLTEQEFLAFAESGDILLFETNNMAAKFQRKFTGSKYDHVGLCVKLGKNDVRVLDSQRDEGVVLTEWSNFIRVNDLFEKVTIRKLSGVDRKIVQEKLINFIFVNHTIRSNIGKKYSFNIKKIISYYPQNYRDQSGREKDPDAYFCSELIAKFFKNIDLLPQNKAASAYWPISFSQEKDLKLENGASLQHEIAILLNKHTKK